MCSMKSFSVGLLLRSSWEKVQYVIYCVSSPIWRSVCLVKLRVLSLPLNMIQLSRLLPPGSTGKVMWPPMQQRPGFRGLCRGAKHRSKRLMYSRSYYSVYPLFLSTWTICSLLHWFIWFLWWPVFGVHNLIVWVTGNHSTSWPVHSSQTHTAHVRAESHKEVKIKSTLQSMASMTFFTNY